MASNHATTRTEPGIRGRRASSTAAALAAALLATTLATGATTSGGDGDVTASDLLDVTLAFEHEPADAKAGATITSEPFDEESEAPVTVDLNVDDNEAAFDAWVDEYELELYDLLDDAGVDEGEIDVAVADADVPGQLGTALDSALAGAEYTVALELVQDPSSAGGGLDHAVVSDAVAGLVPFGSLTLGTAGRGYVLRAAVDDTLTVDPEELVAVHDDISVTFDPPVRSFLVEGVSEPSAWFNIWDNVADCADGACDVGARDDAGGFSADVSTDVDEGWLALNLTEEPLSGEGTCGDVPYQGLPGAALFDSVDVDADKQATFVIDKETVQRDTNNGRAHYDICMVSEDPFIQKGGGQAPDRTVEGDPLAYGPALLEDCHRLPSGRADDPCIESRTGAPGGDVQIVVQLPAADPWMR